MIPHCEINPGCDNKMQELARRVEDLEHALRSRDGIYDQITSLRIQFATLSTSIKVAVAVGSGIGAFLGGAVSVMVSIFK